MHRIRPFQPHPDAPVTPPNGEWLLAAGEHEPTPYKRVYPEWDAWVRGGEVRIGNLTLLDPYAASNSILLQHPLAQEGNEKLRIELLSHELLAYNAFTCWLETELVNGANRDLFLGDVLGWQPDGLRLDAAAIAADESGHTWFTYDLELSFQRQTGIEPVAAKPFERAKRLYEADVAATPPHLRPYRRLFWVIASETLITKNLAEVGNDPTVNPTIRAVLIDHASDEGVHHLYFSAAFRALWPKLNELGRSELLWTVARALDALLRPDPAWIAAVTAAYGVGDGEEIAHELVGRNAVRTGILNASKPTRRLILSADDVDEAEFQRALRAFDLG